MIRIDCSSDSLGQIRNGGKVVSTRKSDQRYVSFEFQNQGYNRTRIIHSRRNLTVFLPEGLVHSMLNPIS